MRQLSFTLVLAAYWLALSGYFKGMLLGLGLGSVLLVVWLSRRMDLIDHEGHPVQLSTRMFGYWFWLGREILLSNLAVIPLILRGGAKPTVGRIRTGGLRPLGRATLANSITLTPGTLSMRVLDGQIEVHSLDGEILKELQSDRLPARVRRFERTPEPQA